MMTREEAEKALRDSAFNEKIQELKTVFADQQKATNALFKLFLASLREEKEGMTLKLRIDGVKEVNELKTAINNLHIPEEVTVNQKITHTTDKVSYKFLWYYFAVSILVIAGILTYTINAYYSHKEELIKARDEGTKNACKVIYERVPEETKKFLRDEFNDFRKIQEEKDIEAGKIKSVKH